MEGEGFLVRMSGHDQRSDNENKAAKWERERVGGQDVEDGEEGR